MTSNGRSIVDEEDQSLLEEMIGRDAIFLVIASSGPKSFDDAMRQIIGVLDKRKREYAVGFLDTDGKHLGAYNRGMLAEHGAADIATRAVKDNAGDGDIVLALIDFVADVQLGVIGELDSGAGEPLDEPAGVVPAESPGGAVAGTGQARERDSGWLPLQGHFRRG